MYGGVGGGERKLASLPDLSPPDKFLRDAALVQTSIWLNTEDVAALV
jgi:hypothetical protein